MICSFIIIVVAIFLFYCFRNVAMLRQLKLILWKNLLIIRKRHWLLTLTEILIPILLFTLVAYGRSKISGMNKQIIDYATHYDRIGRDEIYSHLDVGDLNLWYSPYNDFTEKIIRKVQEDFQIPGDGKFLSDWVLKVRLNVLNNLERFD